MAARERGLGPQALTPTTLEKVQDIIVKFVSEVRKILEKGKEKVDASRTQILDARVGSKAAKVAALRSSAEALEHAQGMWSHLSNEATSALAELKATIGDNSMGGALAERHIQFVRDVDSRVQDGVMYMSSSVQQASFAARIYGMPSAERLVDARPDSKVVEDSTVVSQALSRASDKIRDILMTLSDEPSIITGGRPHGLFAATKRHE